MMFYVKRVYLVLMDGASGVRFRERHREAQREIERIWLLKDCL